VADVRGGTGLIPELGRRRRNRGDLGESSEILALASLLRRAGSHEEAFPKLRTEGGLAPRRRPLRSSIEENASAPSEQPHNFPRIGVELIGPALEIENRPLYGVGDVSWFFQQRRSEVTMSLLGRCRATLVIERNTDALRGRAE